MTRQTPADADARARIRDDLGTTLFVEAAAGTGKTTQLVERIVSLIATGTTTLDRIVAVTFTDKAAGEMKLRLRADLERARVAARRAADRSLLDAALGQLEVARIVTIHSFCGDLLRERPVEAGVDPLFEVMPADEQERLLSRAFDAWFEGVLADPPPGVRRLLRRRPARRDAPGPREKLRGAAFGLVDHRDFDGAWRRSPCDRDPEIDDLMLELAELGALADAATHSDDYLAQNLAEIRRWVTDELTLERSRGARDHDGLEAALAELARSRRIHWHWKGSPRRPYGPAHDRAAVIARRAEVKQKLDAFCARSEADLAPQLREELAPVVDAYLELARRSGKIDFLDLLLRARDLVRDDAAVRRELQERFSHFFVDEFQDTDPLQAELLLLLTADDPDESDWTRATPVPGKLFVVGDPKQSIYRFRRADVAIYEAVRDRLTARGAEVVHLTTSFRALPSIQQAVNSAFEPLLGGPEGYVPLVPHRGEDEAPEQPTLVALPVPRPYGDWGKVVNWRIEDSLPDAVGAWVHWLVTESGWTVHDRERGERVPVAARHVCILFRRLKSFGSDVTSGYVRALEARGIPHVLVGGRSFHDREEVLALRNAMVAVEWPDDELRVFATLRGPLFALGDDALLVWRHRFRRLDPLRRADASELCDDTAPVARALAILGGLHRERNRRPIADTLRRLLDAVRAHAGIAIWPAGEQALANCLRLTDQARRFEQRGAPSFRAFVERLEHDAERGETGEAPVVEEGTEGVRIMTVHRAKGLEFPVVVLADPTCKAAREQPSRHVDPAKRLWAEPIAGCAPAELAEAAADELAEDVAEAHRLAYVAATRARDLLVVPVVGDEELEAPGAGLWLQALNPAVHPSDSERRHGHPAPGCPAFGTDSVLERGPNARVGEHASVAPGLHRPRAGGHSVVWWDPHLLDLDRRPAVGLRQQRILEADEGEGSAAARGIAEHARWATARAATLERGATPSLRVMTVTARSHGVAEGAQAELALGGEEAEAEPTRVETVPGDREARPGGTRFGTLLHAVLATVELGAPDDADVERLASVQARMLGAPPEEAAAAASAARAALAHPLLVRAAAAAERGELRRETPVLLTEDDGSLVEGVVDLAFREEGDGGTPRWIVVDFKSDRELDPERRAAYSAQVHLYARAITAATGAPAEPVLLLA